MTDPTVDEFKKDGVGFEDLEEEIGAEDLGWFESTLLVVLDFFAAFVLGSFCVLLFVPESALLFSFMLRDSLASLRRSIVSSASSSSINKSSSKPQVMEVSLSSKNIYIILPLRL